MQQMSVTVLFSKLTDSIVIIDLDFLFGWFGMVCFQLQAVGTENTSISFWMCILLI